MQLVRIEDEEQLRKLVHLLEQEDSSTLFVAQVIKCVLRFKYTGWEFYTLIDGTEWKSAGQSDNKDGGSLPQYYGVLCVERYPTLRTYIFHTDQSTEVMTNELKKIMNYCALTAFKSIPHYTTKAIRSMFCASDGTMVEIPLVTYVLRDFRKLPEIVDQEHGNEFVVRKIGVEYASVIYSNWKHRRNNVEATLREELQLGLGYGVFVSGQIVSWVVLRRFGAMGILYTLPEYRGRGYASLIVSALSRDIAAHDMTVYVRIEMGNGVSVKFFEKLGFERGPDTACLYHRYH